MTATQARIPAEWAPFAVPIETVKPYPGNAKRHDIDTIRGSLREHGQYRLAVVQASTGYVLVGNGMLEAALLEGWTELAVHRRDYDDDAARALVLLDNRSTELGGYDDAALAALLAQLNTFDGTGYEAEDLEALLALLDSAVPTFGDDDQAVADRQDRAAWPKIAVQVPRDVYARWLLVPATDDAHRVTKLLAAWEASP